MTNKIKYLHFRVKYTYKNQHLYMTIESIASFLIYYVHAPLGAVALLAGGIALVAKKGNKIHKISGKVFFFTMLFSAISALLIAFLPGHESPFLFAIGLFSSYFLLSGLRSLSYRKKNSNLIMDKILAYAILAIGILMIGYPILFYGKINTILAVFGTIGVFFGIRDIQWLSDKERLQKSWLKLHLGKMTGGYIAAVSAFFVVNQFLPGLWNWFAPGILGGFYIVYWMRKMNKKRDVVVIE